MTEIEGIDVPKVTSWFEEHAPGVKPPLEFELIAGGRSNLTYRVTDTNGQRWVLRRPPLGQVLPTAHDMGREHKIISALGPTDVPVPPVVGLCTDDDVNGAPFYVMEYVEGVVVRGADMARKELTLEARRRVGESLPDTLAGLHALDPDAVGLGDLGRREGYIARQLKRWQGQWEQSKQRELPIMDEVHDWLAGNIPEQGPAAIVHGDYRLDNCLLGPDGMIRAVLDWELCTLGDPLADLGILMMYWTEPGDGASAQNAATAVDGFPSRKDILKRYESASGRDLSEIDYYIAFGYWKLACIIEGVYARYKGGAMGQQREGVEGFAVAVERNAETARRAIERLAGT